MDATRPRIPRALALALIALLALLAALAIVFAVTRAPAPQAAAAGHDHGTAPTTSTEQAQAAQLVAITAAGIGKYSDVATAEAAGYRWIGDGTTGGQYRHYVNGDYLLDDNVLDPDKVESLVYKAAASGALQLVSAMYILPPGMTLDEAPAVAGGAASWHIHTNLCWSTSGQIVGTNDSGSCPAASYNLPTPPMLHVWIVDNPLGPFAAIDENGEVSATHG